MDFACRNHNLLYPRSRRIASVIASYCFPSVSWHLCLLKPGVRISQKMMSRPCPSLPTRPGLTDRVGGPGSGLVGGFTSLVSCLGRLQVCNRPALVFDSFATGWVEFSVLDLSRPSSYRCPIVNSLIHPTIVIRSL